ncbi:hypothetical protein CK203_095088 [Vitis vinifera]|uniref:Uncharacterized protein n=1 Tax=Vitis vinifera TaxID=29760 RepID=A0A438EXI1_VITVI|nr:hypothetical protein CK203_095088 [Vitis vinifera]
MVLRSLQSKIVRHVVEVSFTDFGSLVLALYDVEDGISRGLWANSSLIDARGINHPNNRDQLMWALSLLLVKGLTCDISQFHSLLGLTLLGTKRPLASYPTPVQSCYATQIAARPPTFYHRPRVPQTSTHFALRMQRQFLQLGMSLSQALWKVTKTGLLIALALRHYLNLFHHSSGWIYVAHTIRNQCTRLTVYVIRGGRVVRQQSPTTVRPLGVQPLMRRNALIRALSQIRVKTTTTLEGLIHMMTIGKATCIVFSNDDLPPEALNFCLLAIAIALGYAPLDFGPLDFGPSTQTVRAYDSTKREVLRIPTSFNLLLGRPWIHRAKVIPSSLHQKVKFIHDGQTLEIEDFCRDFMAISFDQHSSTMHELGKLLCEGIGATDAFDGIIDGFSTVQETELQRLVHQLQLIDEHGIFAEIGDAHDKYIDEMLAMKVETIAPSLEFAGEGGDQKQLSMGFLSVVEYSEWLVNVVHVPKRTTRCEYVLISEISTRYSQILMAL